MSHIGAYSAEPSAARAGNGAEHRRLHWVDRTEFEDLGQRAVGQRVARLFHHVGGRYVRASMWRNPAAKRASRARKECTCQECTCAMFGENVRTRRPWCSDGA